MFKVTTLGLMAALFGIANAVLVTASTGCFPSFSSSTTYFAGSKVSASRQVSTTTSCSGTTNGCVNGQRSSTETKKENYECTNAIWCSQAGYEPTNEQYGGQAWTRKTECDVRTQDSISSLPNDVGSNLFKAADERALQAYVPSTCTEFVDCLNGFVGDTQETCADACGGECCVGDEDFPDGCYRFTGQVCKDGSCSGLNACQNAAIPEVINSCKPWGSQSGQGSCYDAGNDGNVGKMVDSCWGKNACTNLGNYNGGTVGALTNSCHSVATTTTSPGVCQFLGHWGGSVGNVTSSCYGSETCYQLGRSGVVGPVTNSCGSQVNGESTENTVMGNRNCYRVDYRDGVNNSPISSITNCCSDGSAANQCAGADTDEQLIEKDSTCALTNTANPTTANPTTANPTTTNPTTANPTTANPTTNSPSKEPTSSPSKKPTNSPSKEPTNSPSTNPTTSKPTTSNPTTANPTTTKPTTTKPTTANPTTTKPTTSNPTTANPTTTKPTTSNPTTTNPTTANPTTISPTTSNPTTSNPTTASPTSSNKPTSSPSHSPSKKPTASPSKKPTGIPTTSPSMKPTSSPSMKPSSSPTTPIPTSNPTKKPISNPTERPTDVPTSIVEQTVTIGGSLSANRKVCTFSAAQLSEYVAAALDSIKQVTGCSDSSECQAEITNVCGNTRRDRRRGLRPSSSSLSSSSSRNLQSSTAWQLDFEITQTFTCEYASCNSASDSASTESIIASIVAPIEASLSDDGFLTVLSVNILMRGSFTADFVACLAVWGVVGEPDLDVTPGIEAGTGAGTGVGTGQYFPDWEGGSGTCLQGELPYLYMELNPEVWLYDTLEGCCERYYGGWNKNKCLNAKGSGLWYVSHMKEKCVTDCEDGKGSTCGGLANPISDDLFADPRSCCENELGWRYLEFCEAESLGSSCYAGTGKYYRGDTAGVEVCVRDCDAAYTGDDTCGGLVEDDYIVLHETPEECCELEYDWMTVELCAARTTHTDANVYWPDMIEAKCLLDAQTPAKDLSIPIYDTAADCCEEGVHWLSEGECLTASGVSGANINATNKYFVDWVKERCIQDCRGSAPCGGVGLPQMSWSDLFDTASECCDRIAWVPKKDCVF